MERLPHFLLLPCVLIFICNGIEKVIAFPEQSVLVAHGQVAVRENGGRLLSQRHHEISKRSSDGDSELLTDSIQISSLHILSFTTARFTNTSISSKLVNIANVSKEYELLMELPKEAFITELFIEVDGEIYRSTVEPKEEAQEIYDTAKRCGQTAGIVQQRSEETFAVSINVAPQSDVKCTLIYQQLLLRKKGFYENRISIRPNQIVPDLKVNAYIIEPQGLDEVKAWLQKEEDNDITTSTDLTDRYVELTTPIRAHVLFQPSKEEQLQQSEKGILGDFVIQYDVVHEFNGGNIQVVNGYFVHHFSPEGISPTKKNVVFVIDISGSMSGTKIEQTREAMLTIVDQLREGDTFNIVLFESTVKTWKTNAMVTVASGDIEKAKTYVRALEAGGSTNFYGGIERAVFLLENFHDSTDGIYRDSTLSMIIILSDGQPSAGTSNPDEIIKLTKESINNRYSLFTLGFGNDVDDVFLEKLAGQNRGAFRKIYVDSDSSLQLAGFFDDIATPLLINIEFQYASNAVNSSSITQTAFPSYFEGSELVVAGKLVDDTNEITANVIGGNSDRGMVEIMAVGSVQLSENVKINPEAVEDFTQRLWAYFTIKELLRKQIISDDAKEKQDFEARALELSLKYHFVTPLTSLVVVKPDDPISSNVTSNTTNEIRGECDAGRNFKGAGYPGGTEITHPNIILILLLGFNYLLFCSM